MAEKIYPDGIRENYFANIYCEMAMESLFKSLNSYKLIEESGFSWVSYEEYDSMSKSIISTIVFSAMAIEAFFNDYAAACLGDSDFFDNFDKLTPLSKFELISRFILKGNVDKSKAYYSRLKSLFRNRNLYVHSKSKRASFQGYTSEEYAEINKTYCLDEVDAEPSAFDKSEINSEINQALDALKAVRDIASYFDCHDSNIHAIIRLFGLSSVPLEKQEYKFRVLHKLNIKVDK